MRLYLVRHGRTSMNVEGIAMGQTDADLDGEGERQVRFLEQRFLGVSVSRILSSDLKRAYRTAEAISRATGASITAIPALRERSFGEWEGRDYNEVAQDLHKMIESGVPLSEVRPPGGESHRDVWDRAWPVIEPMFEEKKDVVIVSHGGTCRVMLSQLLCATLATTFCFKFDNTSVTSLYRRPEGVFRMDLYNDTRHVNVPSETEPVSCGTS